MAVAEVAPAVTAAARKLATRVANVVGSVFGQEPAPTDPDALERTERTLNALQSGSYCSPGVESKPGVATPGVPAPRGNS